jgi:hypothetical protein
MPFIVPTFNLLCNVWVRANWDAGGPGFGNPPNFANAPCALRFDQKAAYFAGTSFTTVFLDTLIVPAGADLQFPAYNGANTFQDPDIVEVPSGSNKWYFIMDVHDAAKGYSNEYRLAFILAGQAVTGTRLATAAGYPWGPVWPTPYP